MGTGAESTMSMEESAGIFAAACVAAVSTLDADAISAAKAKFVAMTTDEGKAAVKENSIKCFEANSTDGKMDLEGFKAYLAKAFEHVPQGPPSAELDEKMAKLFAAVDADGDGSLSGDEVGAFMRVTLAKMGEGVMAL